MTVGQRVRVRIADRSEWASGSADCLDGKRGTVEGIELDRVTGRDNVLVRFDEPARTWWTNQTPATAFHFDADDLVGE